MFPHLFRSLVSIILYSLISSRGSIKKQTATLIYDLYCYVVTLVSILFFHASLIIKAMHENCL